MRGPLCWCGIRGCTIGHKQYARRARWRRLTDKLWWLIRRQ